MAEDLLGAIGSIGDKKSTSEISDTQLTAGKGLDSTKATEKPEEKKETAPKDEFKKTETDESSKKAKEEEDKKAKEEQQKKIDELKKQIDELKKMVESLGNNKQSEKPQQSQQASPSQQSAPANQNQNGGTDWDSKLKEDINKVIDEKAGQIAGAQSAANGANPAQAASGLDQSQTVQGPKGTEQVGSVSNKQPGAGVGAAQKPEEKKESAAVQQLKKDWEQSQAEGAQVSPDVSKAVNYVLGMSKSNESETSNQAFNPMMGQVGSLLGNNRQA